MNKEALDYLWEVRSNRYEANCSENEEEHVDDFYWPLLVVCIARKGMHYSTRQSVHHHKQEDQKGYHGKVWK